MTKLMDVLPKIVSAVTCHCEATQTRFLISRVGLRFNSFSEKSENYNKWIIIKSPEKPPKKMLQKDTLIWVSAFNVNFPEEQIAANVLFDTLEDAFDATCSVVGDSITFGLK